MRFNLTRLEIGAAMTAQAEPDRVPCCIIGCRRTFKAEANHQGEEVMCGRHMRCDGGLLERFRTVKRRASRLITLLNRRHAAGTMSPVMCEHIWKRMDGRLGEAWGAIKAEAQRQQDAGFFAPRPRGRSKLASSDRSKPSPLASRFEDQFQRLKRAGR